MQVYIVDDSGLVRSRLVAMLRQLEHVDIAGQAGDAAEALAAIPQLHPDFVILDVHLPDRDGIAVLERIKQLGSPPVVAMLTNYTDDYHRLRCETAGADYFLDKSKEFDAIPGILRKLMQTDARDHG
jgi:DNA-binding NarL/FixJ family response regulator